MRIHWLHLLACLLLIVGSVRFFSASKLWPWLAGLLFVLTPLVVTIFREPLSEPLCLVFFLGIIFSMLQASKAAAGPPLYFAMMAVSAALLVRISALLYLPFLLGAWFVLLRKEEHSAFRRKFMPLGFGCLLLFLVTACYVRPHYIAGILSAHADNVRFLAQRVFTLAAIPVVALLAAAVLAVAFYRKRLVPKSSVALQSAWRLCFVIYGILFAAGLGLRYFWALSHWQHHQGGFPFVLYSPDSLLFYVGPALTVLAVIGWARELYLRPPREFFFFQGYIAFAAFFYILFSFGPIKLQPYGQRYLMEWVALVIIASGMVWTAWLKSRRTLAMATLVFSLGWNIVATYAVNHFSVCQNTYQAYRSLRRNLAELTEVGHKPVLVALAPQWRDLTFLVPLASAYGVSLLSISQGTPEESKAVGALKHLGFNPVFVTSRSDHSPFLDRLPSLLPWKSSEHCYQYPQFDLGAPPTELGQICHSFRIMRFDWTAGQRSVSPK
ncbi:MAG: hypothetical protein HY537_07550 [Deltaproteobacteria bacterium]|nr:hypothetical protein [Deltaproteobacteria bacterium]